MLSLLALSLAAPDAALSALVLDFGEDGMTPPATVVAPLYERACKEGYRPACTPSVWRVDNKANLEAARKVFAPLCAKGDMLACVVEGWALTQVKPGIPSVVGPDPEVGMARFERACDAGLLRGCAEVGTLLREGVGGQADEAAALPFITRACEGGIGNACMGLGTMYLRGSGVDADPARAADYYRQGCDRDDGLSCVGLAYQLAQGRGVPKDGAAATTLMDKACNLGASDGCVGLGFAYLNGWGGQEDKAKAEQLFRAACEQDSAFGCGQLGILQLGADPAAGRATLEQACAGEDARACYMVGRLYREGVKGELTVDLPRALGFFYEACDLGSGDGCLAAAKAWLGGSGTPVDRARGVELAEMACNAEEPEGCYLLARLWMEAGNVRGALAKLEQSCEGGVAAACRDWALLPVHADDRRSLELMSRACEQNDGLACFKLGQLYAEGPTIPIDKPYAYRLFQQSCAANYLPACAEAGALGAHGSVTAEPAQIYAMLERACKANIVTGCTHLGLLYHSGQGVTADPLIAARLYEGACQAGDGEACALYGDLLIKPRAARPWYEAACARGNSYGCEKAEE